MAEDGETTFGSEEGVQAENTEYDNTFLGADYDNQVYESAESWFPESSTIIGEDSITLMFLGGVSVMSLIALVFVAVVATALYKKYITNTKAVHNNEDAEITRNLAEALISGERKTN